MSFGLGVGDVIAVAELAWKLYHFCFVVSRGAPHEFQLLLQQITSLSQSVQLLQLEAKNPTSTLMSSGQDRIQMVGEIMARVKDTLMELEKFAVKYEKMGDTKRAKRKQIWDRLKWSNEAESLDSLRNKLIYHNGIINLLLTSCGNSSLERIEISNRVLERRFSQIGTFIQKIEGLGKSDITPTISAIRVGDRAFKGPILSALLMKSAEVGNRRWSSIGVDEWIQAGRWWLLKSQSTLETGSASEPGQTVSTQGYTDLIKASWVLIDVIARHPQFNLLDSMIRLDAEQLAEAIRSELESIDASEVVPPSSDQIQACDLSIWEKQAKGTSIQPGKRPEAGYRSWETEEEHILLQRFAHYRSSEFATSTPCVVLFVAHKRDKEVHIVLRDQSWITLATFEVGDSHPRPRPVGNFTHIGDQKIEFSTTREAMHICAMADAAEEYIFHCPQNDNEPATLLVLLLLFAIKNGYKEAVKQILRDRSPCDLKPNASASPENLTITIWREASHLATLPVPTVAGISDVAEPQRTGLLRSLIFWGIQAGYKTLATQLMQLKGITTTENDVHQWADLHRAASNGLSEVVRFILSENGTQLGSEGHLAYNLAARSGHSELVRELLTSGMVDDNRLYNDRTTLQHAAGAGHFLVVEAIIQAGVNVNVAAFNKTTALHGAAEGGHEEVVELLLKAGADFNAQMEHCGTALHCAASGGHEAVVKLLLMAGTDVDASAGWSGTALHYASGRGHGAVVELLLKAGSDLNATTVRGTALNLAACGGHGAVVDLLLKAGSDIHTQSRWHDTALRCAAGEGHEGVVELLLKAGSDLNATTGRGTALRYAAGRGHVAVVELLLKTGSDLNATTGRGTALNLAASGGHVAVVELLLKAGLDINAPMVGGHTVLHRAAGGGHEALVELLLRAGSDINAQTWSYDTPLHFAAGGGHEAVVELLLDAGADISITAKHWEETALRYAIRGGHEGVAQLLRKASKDIYDQKTIHRTRLHLSDGRRDAEMFELIRKAGKKVRGVSPEL